MPPRYPLTSVFAVSGHWRRPAHPSSRSVLTGPAWEDHFTLLSALRTDAAATAVAFVRRQGEATLLAIGDAAGDLLLATPAGVVLAEWPSGTCPGSKRLAELRCTHTVSTARRLTAAPRLASVGRLGSMLLKVVVST